MKPETKKKFLKSGKIVEREFAKLFRSTELSSVDEDINEHWDITVKYKIDVKGLKKIRRIDTQVDENFHWIEIKGITGFNGWLYSDQTDFFSFETFDYWVIVEKNTLQEFIKNKCSAKEYSNVPMLYKLYKRAGRNDVITLVKTIDLIYISECLISKNK